MHAEKSLAEIAGYDDTQLVHVVARRRDKYGKLLRGEELEELPPGVEVDGDGMRTVSRPVSFASMFRSVEEARGRTPEASAALWQAYVTDNPRLRGAGE